MVVPGFLDGGGEPGGHADHRPGDEEVQESGYVTRQHIRLTPLRGTEHQFGGRGPELEVRPPQGREQHKADQRHDTGLGSPRLVRGGDQGEHGLTENGNAGYCPFTIESYGFVNAYYRVAHDETDTFLAQTSAPVHLTRVLTRFTSFSITPTRPAKNARFTASGTLQHYTGGRWQSYKGAQVMLVFKPKGDTKWYWVTKGSTGTGGKYSLRGIGYQDGSWAVVLQPDAKHFYSETKAKYVDVR